MIGALITFFSKPEVKGLLILTGTVLGLTAVNDAIGTVTSYYGTKAEKAVEDSRAVKAIEAELNDLSTLKTMADLIEEEESKQASAEIAASKDICDLKEAIRETDRGITERTKTFDAEFGLKDKIADRKQLAEEAIESWKDAHSYNSQVSELKKRKDSIRSKYASQKQIAQAFDEESVRESTLKIIRTGEQAELKDVKEELDELKKELREFSGEENNEAAKDIAALRKAYSEGKAAALGDLPKHRSTLKKELDEKSAAVRMSVENRRDDKAVRAFNARDRYDKLTKDIANTKKEMLSDVRNVGFGFKLKVYLHDNVAMPAVVGTLMLPVVFYVRWVYKFCRSVYHDPLCVM